MGENFRVGGVSGFKTSGVGTFGEGEGGAGAVRLFRVEAGHSAGYVLEQASVLIDCVHKLTLQAGIEQDGTSAWAAHYLAGMAKALVEDLAFGLPAKQ
ncbi:DUF3077 domain-containing protein [Pseudomonas alkylphenolica]|uniref:DUF3077 domain-containing protein n=1 Tax=Pseudomonas alkylphenolica TaxID=237609 RepID=UPI0018D8DB6F|nr:DUF3077 domain-containing protein [Pseudomonas alkylphenolica]MBH3426184.1 DUF3077 domain-containing protein [Pseudomonas alkylphenolica]